MSTITREQQRTRAQAAGTQAGMHPEDQPETTSEQPARRRVYAGLEARPIPLPDRPTRRPVTPTHYPTGTLDADYGEGPGMALPRSARRYPSSSAGVVEAGQHPAPARTHAGRTEIRVTHHHAGERVAPTRRTVSQTPARTAEQAVRPRPGSPSVVLAEPGLLRRVLHTARTRWRTVLAWGSSMLVCGTLLVTLTGTMWQSAHDGTPRTVQVDQVVGDDAPSRPTHFVGINLHGRVSVLEMREGDPSRVTVIPVPIITEPDKPVTLTFRDVSHHGHRDLLVQVGQSYMVFLNDGHGTFRPAGPHDPITA